MKIKMEQAFRLNEICKKFAEQLLPIKTSYRVAKTALALEQEILFCRAQYTKYLNLYAQTDEDGNFITNSLGGIMVKEGMEEESKQKFEELDNLEIEIPEFELTLEELDGVEITVADMAVLVPFIKE